VHGMGMGGGRFGVAEEDKLAAGDAARVVRRTIRLLRHRRRLLLTALGLSIAWTGTTLAGPALVRFGIDHGIRRGRSAPLDLAVAGYVVVAATAYLLHRAQIEVIAKVGEGFLRELRVKAFAHLQRLSMPFYDREKAGVVVSRMTSDIDALAEVVQQGILQFSTSGMLLVGTLALLCFLSWPLALVVLAVMPGVILTGRKFRRDSNRAYLDVREGVGQTLSSLQEGLAGVRVVQAFARESTQIERFAGTNQLLLHSHLRSVFIQSWYVPCVETSSQLAMAGVVGIGGLLVHQGTVSVGTVAAFVLLLNNLFEPLQNLTQLLNTLQSAGAALEKVYRLMDTPLDVPERSDPVPLPARGPLRLEGVSFSYDGERSVLAGVDLEVAPGERLALVGPTGAGKSTLAKLAARLYDPTEGRVTFGGVDLRNTSNRSLRSRIVVVPQEGYLFNGTVLDNIRLTRADADEDEVWLALQAVGVAERFASLPQGLQTEVNERGSRFSAGERQLISLARAALVDPAVLVLDEATSSLDPGTELLVEEALERLMAGRTVVVIAHRLSTAQRCDRVGVVADGRLVELGGHDELLDRGRAYAALFGAWSRGVATA
jgi:ATP-binding cassette subfamily B protein